MQSNQGRNKLTAITSARVVEVRAGNDSIISADSQGQIRERDVARIDVSAIDVRESCVHDRLVVRVGVGVRKHEKGGTSVGNSGNSRVGVYLAVANTNTRDLEAPVALGVVDRNSRDGAVVLGSIDEAKVVGAGLALLQVDGEDGFIESVDDIVEEGILSHRADAVELAEGKTDETIVILVQVELSGNRCRSFNGLGGRSDAADGDLVDEDVASSARAVAVGDDPGGVDHLGAVVGNVDGVAVGGLGRELRGEDPSIRG